MALTGFHKRKLDAIRSRVSQDKVALDDARAEAHIEGYAKASKDWQLEMAGLREELDTVENQFWETNSNFRRTLEYGEELKKTLRQSEAEVARHKADITLLKAAVETMKAEVTATRMASREPRKAAVTECLAILKRERTVARSEAVLRNMLKDL